MNFFCIADKDSSLGFRFAGIEIREVTNRSQAMESLKVALSMEGVGVVLVTAKAASFIQEEVDKLVYRQYLPLVLEIPSRGQAPRKKNVGEFLKSAIGISV